MRISADKLLLALCFISCSTAAVYATHGHFTPPNLPRLTDRFPRLTFSSSFSEVFGGPANIHTSANGSRVDLILDKSSGWWRMFHRSASVMIRSGFVSKDYYSYGFFSAAIKLPPDYTAGIVVAFYMSNADMAPHNHDEIDFELLGHEKRKEWALQTNFYGNGSCHGREEKFYLWFDPTQAFHSYSLLWNEHHIVFLVDNIPVREINHSSAIAQVYPSKPMSVYATIWDGSEWATRGGKKPVNYQYAPFQATFTELQMEGCKWNPKIGVPSCSKSGQSDRPGVDPIAGNDFISLSQQQKMGMMEVRNRFMFYSYCQDKARFSVLPPECKQM